MPPWYSLQIMSLPTLRTRHRRHGWAFGATPCRADSTRVTGNAAPPAYLWSASSPPSTGTCGGLRGGPSAAHWPSSVSPRIRRSDMRRSVSGFGSASRIQRRSGGTFSSWSPLAGESPASWEAGGNNGNRNDSCQAPFGVGDLAVPGIPRYAVGVMAQNQCRVHKNPTPLSGRFNATGQFRQNRICM